MLRFAAFANLTIRYGLTFALSRREGGSQVRANLPSLPGGHSSPADEGSRIVQDNNRSRPRKRLTPRYYSVGLEIPGLSRPIACVITAFSRREALRQARGMLTGIKVRIMSGC